MARRRPGGFSKPPRVDVRREAVLTCAVKGDRFKIHCGFGLTLATSLETVLQQADMNLQNINKSVKLVDRNPSKHGTNRKDEHCHCTTEFSSLVNLLVVQKKKWRTCVLALSFSQHFPKIRF